MWWNMIVRGKKWVTVISIHIQFFKFSQLLTHWLASRFDTWYRLCIIADIWIFRAQPIDGLFPKAYYTGKEMIIMENITKRGYQTLSKIHKLDFKHAKYLSSDTVAAAIPYLNYVSIIKYLNCHFRLVLESLGRFHGAPHAIIVLNGKRWQRRFFGKVSHSTWRDV